MAINGSLVTFSIYLVGMLIIGIVTYRMTQTFSDAVPGRRGLGSWVTGMSAEASDMGGWLLLGRPGVAFGVGMRSRWIAIELAAGTLLNWIYTSKRLRRYTQLLDALSLADYF